MSQSLLISNIGTLYGILDEGIKRLAGTGMAKVKSISNAYLHISAGVIDSFGGMDEMPSPFDVTVMDVKGASVLPCWCDSHTHIVYSKNRESEFVQRIQGASYEAIAQAGGGILNSAKHLNRTKQNCILNHCSN